jgi:hypothetical protein
VWISRHTRSINLVMHAVKPELKATVCEALLLWKGC